jgi:small GTP-binding protein
MEIYNRGVYIKNVLDDIEKQYLNKKTNLGNKKENIKIILFGDSGVGKTSIINQFVNGGFNDETLMTITQYKLIKEIKLLNEKKIKLEIWDYPGIESYRNLFQIFIKKINIVLLIYNINNKVTFDNLDIWYKMADEIIGKDNVIFCVIGNDIDLYENHIVDSEIGKEYAKKINALFFEINTRDHESVENIFIQIINEYYGLSNN